MILLGRHQGADMEGDGFACQVGSFIFAKLRQATLGTIVSGEGIAVHRDHQRSTIRADRADCFGQVVELASDPGQR